MLSRISIEIDSAGGLNPHRIYRPLRLQRVTQRQLSYLILPLMHCRGRGGLLPESISTFP